jgi:DMSO/TMAO reductase YedYZ molybdopterin-dependent catalytic subunit
MATSDRSETRRREIREILERKPGTREVRDDEDRYTVVGAADRSTFADWLTPVEEHFVCHRNDVPEIDGDEWSVRVTGIGDRGGADRGNDEGEDDDEDENADAGRRLSMAAIRESYPTVATAHTMECAGNNRGQHDPETGSVQWGYDAAATAFWTGTPLRAVLKDCGVDVEAAAGGGADGSGGADGRWLTVVGGDPPADDRVYVKSIPLAKAVDDCVLAYGMNGGDLPPEHGFPVRLIVPGWYGTNSVKWVDELRVTDRMVTEATFADRDDGRTYTYWQHESYRIHPAGVTPNAEDTVPDPDTWAQLVGDDVAHPYTFDENVTSLIGRPDGESPVAPDPEGRVEVGGVAWAGDDRVVGVEVSTDGGDSWHDAELYGPDYDGAWRLFAYTWEPDLDASGGGGGGDDGRTYTLLSRATDERGRTQPATIERPEAWGEMPEDAYPWNEGGYAANAYRPNGVGVEVVPDGES